MTVRRILTGVFVGLLIGIVTVGIWILVSSGVLPPQRSASAPPPTAATVEQTVQEQLADKVTELDKQLTDLKGLLANCGERGVFVSSTGFYDCGPEKVAAPEPLATEPAMQEGGSDIQQTLMDNSYMTAYQGTLEYTVPTELQVPKDLLKGFVPVDSLVMTEFKFPDTANPIPGLVVNVPPAPTNVLDWECFPQDYSEGDDFNRGCKKKQESGALPWNKPIAGYNDGENWSCDSPDGWCADDIQSFNWRVITGYEVCHPAVGCLKDPDGGAVMILFVNFHDSDEVWGPRNSSAIYVDSGFIGYGMMWDLSGGTYDIGEGIAALRNHYFFNLSYQVGGDNRYAGQCGSSGLCPSVTYVVVARVWDRPELGIEYSHFELLNWGQWKRP